MPDPPPKQLSRLPRPIRDGSFGNGSVGDDSRGAQNREGPAATGGFDTRLRDPGIHDPGPVYAELQVTSNFSFLRGASHPDELVATAAALGQAAIAITDRNTLAGIVRAHHAAKTVGLRLVVGVRLDLRDGTSLLAYPQDRAAYGRLTRLLTLGKRRAAKGGCSFNYADLVAHGEGLIVIALPPEPSFVSSPASVREDFAARVAADFAGRAYLAAHCLYRGDDASRLARLAVLAEHSPLPLVAVNDVLYHAPRRRPLQDVMTCIREHCTIHEAGFRLAANAERHLKPPAEMARLFRCHQDAVARTAEIVARCRFSLDELRYEYPEEPVPAGMTPQRFLAALVWAGAAERFSRPPKDSLSPAGGEGRGEGAGDRMCEGAGDRMCEGAGDRMCEGAGDRISERPPSPFPFPPMGGEGSAPEDVEGADTASDGRSPVPDRIRRLIAHELALIERLDYARYFLTVRDLVAFARSRGILCQGRGSAANSVVCYCLGITAVDPARIDVLFERFISAARNEPPDIDVDFEHERREEVIQYIYGKYGRERAGLAATVICYRARGAIREVGKVLGLSGDVAAALAGLVWGWSNDPIGDRRVREAGLDPADRTLRLALDLAAELIGFPRHLSQHVGGFVITRGPLSELVPIENAAMADRTFIEWDKDDLDALGILKIDLLALGMLSCIRRAFALIEHHDRRRYTLATVPPERPEVYEMLSRADSLGVFQVESRAQMTMLPRLKPRTFYDLVIEVAIVRPGPIQGDMVHPYLRRRAGREPVDYPSPELRLVLEKTLGVPLFQEQAMQIAIVGAGFSPEDADRLRRAMATFKRSGEIRRFRDKFVEGMIGRNYTSDFATRCFDQIEGFGTYGFPESHAASFALLVYVSAWIKCFHPEVFACALLNSQPMGFYAPAQIVRDARGHGVAVRPVDVNFSDWDCTLEADDDARAGHGGPAPRWALRLGLRLVKGLAETDAARLVAARGAGYADMRNLWRRSGLGRGVLERLAAADALRSLGAGKDGAGTGGLDRRRGLWAVRAMGEVPLPLFAAAASGEREAEPAEGDGSSREDRESIAASLLPEMPLGEHVVEDYATTGLTLKRHPLAFLRLELRREGLVCAADLAGLPVGRLLAIAGLVLIRQRPGSANGVVFITIEDESGVANLIVWPATFERFRRAALGATLLYCRGRLQREAGVIHLVAEHLRDWTARLDGLRERGAVEPAPGEQRGRRNPGRDGRGLAIPSRNFR